MVLSSDMSSRYAKHLCLTILKSFCAYINAETANLILNTEIGAMFFLTTHHLDMANTCAKLF